ncbi:helix-turn-helix domain-containing protein [Nonomuraea insulae]|uniref:Helix-turn-helix domain-containing protein n=1 Tax=Nonomuraea insulae TaxID=1616787 RepID=A0ABW1D357_9ACTN
MSDTWTIGELAEHAALALRDGAPPAANGRVRDVPGERLIRWYTTIGLVDPPLTRRGRIARYGRRHLLQIVAVKRLQAAGRSIAEIQTALAGATDRMLETAAGLDDTPVAGETWAAGAPAGTSRATDGEPVRERFWAERPGTGTAQSRDTGARDTGARDTGARDTGARLDAGAGPRPGGDPAGESADDVAVRGRAVTGIRLRDGVRIVLDAGRVPSEEDIKAVLAAAGPLLAVLEERELT